MNRTVELFLLHAGVGGGGVGVDQRKGCTTLSSAVYLGQKFQDTKVLWHKFAFILEKTL